MTVRSHDCTWFFGPKLVVFSLSATRVVTRVGPGCPEKVFNVKAMGGAHGKERGVRSYKAMGSKFYLRLDTQGAHNHESTP